MYKIGSYCFENISDYQKQLLDKKFCCEDIVLAYLKQIEAKKHLNIFIEVFAEEAIAKAKQIDEKIQHGTLLGNLFGVVFSIKDVFCYEGHKVSAASNILQDFVASYDATCVRKIKNQDAIIIGRVNCDEFAMGASNQNSCYGAVKNPLNEALVSGGSSGGSAASVAANLCMVSLGSDTGGSVRQPADFCGVYGLKPTYGRISRYGLIAYASSLDSVGIIANSLDDMYMILKNMEGQDGMDNTCKPIPQTSNNHFDKIRIAYFNQVFDNTAITHDIKNIFKNTLHTYAHKYEVKGIDFPYIHLLVPTYYLISCAEAASNLSRYDGIRYGKSQSMHNMNLKDFYRINRTKGFGKEVKKRIMLGNFVLSAGYKNTYYGKAQQIRNMLINKTDDIFNNYDAILMPNSPFYPWTIGGDNHLTQEQLYTSDIFSVLANLIASPAISFPVHKNAYGLSCGVQLIGKKFSEEKLIQYAKSFYDTQL